MSRLALAVVACRVTLAAAVGVSPHPGVRPMGGGARLSYGDTIKSDTTLRSDLVGCESNGIIIDADDVTLDLNGHTIRSDGRIDPGCDPSSGFGDLGVVVEGHTGVLAEDGVIRRFQLGLVLIRVHASRVVDLRRGRRGRPAATAP